MVDKTNKKAIIVIKNQLSLVITPLLPLLQTLCDCCAHAISSLYTHSQEVYQRERRSHKHNNLSHPPIGTPLFLYLIYSTLLK